MRPRIFATSTSGVASVAWSNKLLKLMTVTQWNLNVWFKKLTTGRGRWWRGGGNLQLGTKRDTPVTQPVTAKLRWTHGGGWCRLQRAEVCELRILKFLDSVSPHSAEFDQRSASAGTCCPGSAVSPRVHTTHISAAETAWSTADQSAEFIAAHTTCRHWY